MAKIWIVKPADAGQFDVMVFKRKRDAIAHASRKAKWDAARDLDLDTDTTLALDIRVDDSKLGLVHVYPEHMFGNVCYHVFWREAH